MYDMPKDRVVQVRVDEQLLARLDQRRGPASRSDYIRALIENSALVIPDTETGYVPDTPVAAPLPDPYSSTGTADPPVPVAHGEPPHRHKPGPKGVETVYIAGQRHQGYICPECGEVITR